jgi:hypothetical protein
MTQPTKASLQAELDYLRDYLANLPDTDYVDADRRAMNTPDGVGLAPNENLLVGWAAAFPNVPKVQRGSYVSALQSKADRYQRLIDHGGYR